MSDKKIDYIQSKVDSVSELVINIDKDMAIQKAALEAHTKQDEKMYDEFRRMNDILQENTLSLKEHMGRTAILEEIAKKMDDRLNNVEVDRIQKAAVRDWVMSRLKFIAKLGAAGAAVSGAWVYLKPIVEHLFK